MGRLIDDVTAAEVRLGMDDWWAAFTGSGGFDGEWYPCDFPGREPLCHALSAHADRPVAGLHVGYLRLPENALAGPAVAA